MKEVTHEDWLENPTPRMMWVWDNDKYEKKKRKVICVLSGASGKKYNVLALNPEETCTTNYAHCAEVEAPKTRRMTNKELSRWLREKPTREWKYNSDSQVYTSYDYKEEWADEECWSEVVVREDDGEWKEPLVEDHYKD